MHSVIRLSLRRMCGALLDGSKKFGLEYAEPGEPALWIRVIRVGDYVVSLSPHSWDANW